MQPTHPGFSPLSQYLGSTIIPKNTFKELVKKKDPLSNTTKHKYNSKNSRWPPWQKYIFDSSLCNTICKRYSICYEFIYLFIYLYIYIYSICTLETTTRRPHDDHTTTTQRPHNDHTSSMHRPYADHMPTICRPYN